MKHTSRAGCQVQNNVTAAQDDARKCRPWQRGRRVPPDQSGRCFVEESFFSVTSEPAGHKSPEVNDEEYTLAW